MLTQCSLFLFILLSFQVALAQTPPAAEPLKVEDVKLVDTKVEPAKPAIVWSGDVRYRMAKSKESIDDERTFNQLRVRLGLRADVNESTQAVIRLATATSAISSNQTLGDSAEPGMARRPFGIDLAYIDFKFWEKQASFWIGRTANPFFAPAKVQTLFDSDLAFEGLAFKLEKKTSYGSPFVNLGAFIISENYTQPDDNVDTGLIGGDLGYAIKNDDWSWASHFGNYYYVNVKNHVITRVEKDAKIDVYSNNPNERFRGNTVYVNDPLLVAADRKYFYAYQYILLEAGTEFKHKLGDFEYTLYFDAIRNDAARKDRDAYEGGASVKWKWATLGYAMIRKEADSVLSSFTDSDANGGGTGSEGTRALLNFALNKNASLQITQFAAKRGIDVVKRNFSMTHVDLAVSF